MKRKDYKEVSPEPIPSSWAASGREDNDLYYWEEVVDGEIPST
jgi:hypothetical protein